MASPESADVIVLEADGHIDDSHGYGYLIKKRIEEAGFRAELVRFAENAGVLDTLPQRPLIVSGGMTEVTSSIRWIVRSREFFSRLIGGNISGPGEPWPVMGVCFGAQLLAEAYRSGSVMYLDKPEIGTSLIELDLADHPLFAGLMRMFPAYTFHYNQIKKGGLLAISAHEYGDNRYLQAFEIPGAHCWGVQFHPEFRYEEARRWIQHYGGLINELGLDAEGVLSDLPDSIDNSRIFTNFLAMC